MLNFPGAAVKIFVALDACDMRAGACTLQGLVAERLKENVREGALFVFTNKRRTVLKMLYRDGTGTWVLTKKLAAGTFSWPAPAQTGQIKLSLAPEALALLTGGVDLRGARLRPWYERE
jgi:transposase